MIRPFCALVVLLFCSSLSLKATLRIGTARVDISRVAAPPSPNTLYAKALVLADDARTAVIVTLDAVAVGEIGSIRNDFLANVRTRLQRELNIPPDHVIVNASHCHGIVHAEVEERTVAAVRQAAANLRPVRVGAGTGTENRIMENRRLRLKNGREIDVRHAYSLPPDDAVAAVGPVDPEIGVLRFDTLAGDPLAVVYNFACHPIKGTPATGGNTADIVGFASAVIEENLGPDTTAFFLQGCGGDINPIRYKEVDVPRDAQPLGNLLGLSTLRAVRAIQTREVDDFAIINRRIEVPRADLAARIAEMEQEKERLLKSLRGTTLNLKTFMSLYLKQRATGSFPAADSYVYLREQQMGVDDRKRLDEQNQADVDRYRANVLTMEALTRLMINRALLEKHLARNRAAEMKPLAVEVAGLRVGDFRLVTFPGELTVPIGLNIKRRSPHELTFVAGYTNGYIYYCPTAEQLRNVGGAQEDSDCLLAPEWQVLFEDTARRLLEEL